ncbi:glycosyl hydrolase [Sphingobium yanoikuyae]|uniref:glycosyl hydrolase n=1 Tax=Sphingobium yanoikuyae TaxID=13690 RepID=UPI002FDB0F29
MKGIGLHYLVFSIVGFLFYDLAFVDCASAAIKKGIAIGKNAIQASEKISKLRVGWYYTWGSQSILGVKASFVPMVWGRKSGIDFYSCSLLLFNEPDSDTQSSIDVSEAVEKSVSFRKMAKTIGSPATVNSLNSWMSEYIAAAERRSIKIDFIAIHWYGGPSPAQFLKKVDATYARYRRPIWITEFAVADWAAKSGKARYTPADVERFMRKVLPELERRAFVQRYAWMGADSYSSATAPSRLFDDNGFLTPLGRIYRSFNSRAAPGDRC